MAAVATVHEELHPATGPSREVMPTASPPRASWSSSAGQIGWTGDQIFEARDLVGQTRQTLANIAGPFWPRPAGVTNTSPA